MLFPSILKSGGWGELRGWFRCEYFSGAKWVQWGLKNRTDIKTMNLIPTNPFSLFVLWYFEFTFEFTLEIQNNEKGTRLGYTTFQSMINT